MIPPQNRIHGRGAVNSAAAERGDRQFKVCRQQSLVHVRQVPYHSPFQAGPPGEMLPIAQDRPDGQRFSGHNRFPWCRRQVERI
jgi:hypothetical protein